VRLAERTHALKPSATLAVTAQAKQMSAAGADILVMSAGEPDFDTPPHVCEAAARAMRDGDTRYTPVAGTGALRAAIAARYRARVDETLVSCGAKQALFNACAALLNPGDEALIAVPYWVSYPDMVRLAGAIPCFVPATRVPDAADWARHISPRTRLLILNSPSNPAGQVSDRAQLEGLAKLMRDHPELFVISDEIYDALVYDAPFVSLRDVAPDLRDRILVVAGVSKTYAMTGWRIGFCVGPKALIDAMSNLQGASTSGACSIAQAAAHAALTGPQECVEQFRAAFHARRDRLVAGLRGLGLTVESPAGAFYTFPQVPGDSMAWCRRALEHAKVAVVPGLAFGDDARVRISFACSEADIDEAVRRLGDVVHAG
jgi:aspartate aminotransferase